MKIYLAHQISGLGYDEVVAYYKHMKELLGGYGYEILQPMTGKGYLRTETKFREHGYDNPVSTNHAIFERDKWMVTQADVVLIDLYIMDRVSIGCMMELAWAALLGKHTIVVMKKDSPHRHAFVMDAADMIFETIDEATNYLRLLALQEEE